MSLNQIYLYHLLPIIEYASLVWDSCTQQDCNTLQKIQNEAARIVTGLTRSVSLVNLYNECGWTNLSVRRHQQKLHFMYKVNNGLVPSYITDLFPPLVSEISGYPLRNSNNFSTPFTRTNISLRSCVFHQPSESGTLLTKASKISQQYLPLRTTCKLLLFLNYKYLTTSHQETDIYQ